MAVPAREITGTSESPRSRKSALTRAKLVHAAKQVFEEDGFLDARISDIAERAGLSHGSFYTYFESKEEIFREVALDVDVRFSAPLADVIRAPGSTTPPRERIREAIRRHLENYQREARIMGVIEQVSRYDATLMAARAAQLEEYGSLVADSIGQLQRRGLVDARLDPDIAAAVLGSMTNRFPEMWLVQGLVTCEFEDGLEHLTIMFMNALQLIDPEHDPVVDRVGDVGRDNSPAVDRSRGHASRSRGTRGHGTTPSSRS